MTKIENASDGIPSTTLREIAILKELEHPCVVGLHDVVHQDSCIYFIMEFCSQDLHRYLQLLYDKQQSLTQSQIKNYMRQILEAVAYCHSERIMHRDLKPANILLSGENNQNIKIADFGLARAFSIPIKPYTSNVVTQYYRSPELLLQMSEYAIPIDLWSVGCIFAELVTRQPFFRGESEIAQLMQIFRIMGTPSE